LQPYLRGIYRLPEQGFIVDSQLVRGPQDYQIRLGGIPGFLSFPQLARGSFGWPRLIVPPGIKLGGEADRSSGRAQSNEWGAALIKRFDEEGWVLVTMVGMRFPLPDGDAATARRVTAQLFEAVGPWSTGLSSWLDVISERNPKPSKPFSLASSYPAELHGLELVHVDQAGDSTPQRPAPQPIPFGGKPITYVTKEAWRAILSYVSEGAAPPTERLLLHSAVRALDDGYPRRSVLDSATAAEIALTRMLDDRLRSSPQKLANAAPPKPRVGLGRVISNLRRLGVELPSELETVLVKTRNAAIHEGSEPTKEQARVTFLLVKALVDRAHPLQVILNRYEN
jgi:hypothetical protein